MTIWTSFARLLNCASWFSLAFALKKTWSLMKQALTSKGGLEFQDLEGVSGHPRLFHFPLASNY